VEAIEDVRSGNFDLLRRQGGAQVGQRLIISIARTGKNFRFGQLLSFSFELVLIDNLLFENAISSNFINDYLDWVPLAVQARLAGMEG
jgi:hypothetical protein